SCTAIICVVIVIAWVASYALKPRALGGPVWSGWTTELELRNEDYAEARKSFRTKLVRSGPSPQPVTEDIRIPEGVVSIDYTSDNLTLAAWVDSPPADGQKHPAVLFLHGGFAFGGDDLEMPQHFRDSGYVVLEPVLRGENGQPG